jgi:hypothetical protein
MKSKTAIGAAAAALLCWGQPAPDCQLVPGWSQKGPARTFIGEDLFEYMDGNSEGYLIYGFRNMKGVTCAKDGVEFILDVSEMADPDAAYGIFSATRNPGQPVVPIGTAAEIQPRRAVMVKDRYYVEIAVNQEGDHAPALKAFMTAMEARIPGSTALPATLSWFPAEARKSLRLIPESVLGIRLLRRGYVGEYDFGKAFLVKETSPDAAAAVMEKLRARFGATRPAQVADEGFHYEEKYLGRMCVFRKGAYVGGWANVAEGRDPLELAGALASQVH